MHELEKIKEARYFFTQMKKELADSDPFNHNLSAFLSSTRSVLQYSLNEVNGKSGGQKWYDDIVSKSNVVKFFKDKRDINIHKEPIPVKKKVNATHTESIGISESIVVIRVDSEGKKIILSSISPHSPERDVAKEQLSIEFKYFFSDWPGSEDALDLCSKYLEELEEMVKDGIKRGLLS